MPNSRNPAGAATGHKGRKSITASCEFGYFALQGGGRDGNAQVPSTTSLAEAASRGRRTYVGIPLHLGNLWQSQRLDEQKHSHLKLTKTL